MLNAAYSVELMRGAARANLALAYFVVACVTVVVSGLIFIANYTAAQLAERAKSRWIGVGFTIGYALPFGFQLFSSVPGLSVRRHDCGRR